MINRRYEPKVSGVIEALRSATRSHHARLAATSGMLRLFNAAYTISEYRAHLGRLFGLLDPLERAVASVGDPADPVCALPCSLALREDMRFMGATTGHIETLERCRQLPLISLAGLPGYTYVILGSMLGGKIIVKRLQAVLGPRASFHFYSRDSSRSEELWESFCTELEGRKENNVEAICDTAVGILDAYAVWLSDPILNGGIC